MGAFCDGVGVICLLGVDCFEGMWVARDETAGVSLLQAAKSNNKQLFGMRVFHGKTTLNEMLFP